MEDLEKYRILKDKLLLASWALSDAKEKLSNLGGQYRQLGESKKAKEIDAQEQIIVKMLQDLSAQDSALHDQYVPSSNYHLLSVEV